MNHTEMKQIKFATQIEESTLEDLRAYAKSTGRSISGVVTEAVGEYLNRASVRPAFRNAMSEVLEDHDELLNRLAK
jgi:hypothetical protein